MKSSKSLDFCDFHTYESHKIMKSRSKGQISKRPTLRVEVRLYSIYWLFRIHTCTLIHRMHACMHISKKQKKKKMIIILLRYMHALALNCALSALSAVAFALPHGYHQFVSRCQ
ncbi:unnamed protein product [Ceratitis capitata]|uniref:(Mediterranean fruit fly) hypothetical protein n=1 Tax=Ceratitis capitata TaxID=7213 RepID=A0A811U627_CERCA|nr:unnamed protein product [Ceratitis capitata]